MVNASDIGLRYGRFYLLYPDDPAFYAHRLALEMKSRRGGRFKGEHRGFAPIGVQGAMEYWPPARRAYASERVMG